MEIFIDSADLAEIKEAATLGLIDGCTTNSGLLAKTFKKEGIRTNVTLCFSATQAMLAAKAGAAYISPFIGRIDDTASVRSLLHVLQAALVGSHCATVPVSVVRQLIKHPLTDVGLAKFLEDNNNAASAAQ